MSGPVPGIAPVPVHSRTRRLRWLAIALIVFIVVAAFLLPLVNINRYDRTIADSLTRSLGRPVHLGSVQMQLLPHPGLAISDFVVEEGPGFGAEPLLRAPSVTVSLRILSLWRGRIEASHIELDNASVNLAHDAAGRWNFESLLVQASRIPNAPTAQRRLTASPRFPYIEFQSARFNFKDGYEKKPFSFVNADLSIWLAEPDQWRLRVEAQPARTDLELDLSDTGLIRLEGSLKRAPALDQMPVSLHAEWTGAPIGQVSRLIFGRDSGWRGDLRAEADIAGDLRNLQLQTRLRVDNTHRLEFSPLTPLDIDARCRGTYRRTSRSLDGLTCLWPVGDGHLLLTGDVQNLPQPLAHLSLEINRTPAAFAVSALGLLRRTLPASVDPRGTINGQFTYATNGFPSLTGEAVVDHLSLSLPQSNIPLQIPSLRFASLAPPPAPGPGKRNRNVKTRPQLPAGTTIVLSAAPLALGAPGPLQIAGQFTRSGFDLHVTGQASVDLIASLSRATGRLSAALSGLASPTPSRPSIADLDFTFTGPWTAPVSQNPPSLTEIQGWARLQHAQIKLDWLPEPVEISAATVNFTPGKATWSNAAFNIGEIAARGSATYPLLCTDPSACTAQFNLDMPSLDAATLQSALLGAGRHGELLTAILAQVERKTAPWPALNGTLHIGSLTLGPLALHDAQGSVTIRGNTLSRGSTLTIDSLDAGALGGSLHAAGTIDTAGSKPAYALDINWNGIAIPQAAALFHEKWGTGSISGRTRLALEGYSTPDLVSSAKGTFQWDWSSGSLPLPAGENLLPARFNHWLAAGTIDSRKLTLAGSDIAHPVTGTITFDRELDLLWPAKNQQTLHLQGTLAHPAIEPAHPNPAPATRKTTR